MLQETWQVGEKSMKRSMYFTSSITIMTSEAEGASTFEKEWELYCQKVLSGMERCWITTPHKDGHQG